MSIDSAHEISLHMPPVKERRSMRRGLTSVVVELEAKTQGWVAGNVHLDRNVSLRIGGSAKLS